MDVFFVISGFLITDHLWRGYQRTATVADTATQIRASALYFQNWG